VARPGSFLIARTAGHRELLRRELAQSRGWGAVTQGVWQYAHFYDPITEPAREA
jgi:hypothetical protein